MKKSLSNKAFNKVFSLLTDSLTPERVSAIIDARPEDGLDALILGRLSKVSITNEAKFNVIVEQELKKRYWNNFELHIVTEVNINISGVMSFDVKGLYHQGKNPEEQQEFSLSFSAADDVFDDCVEFEFTD